MGEKQNVNKKISHSERRICAQLATRNNISARSTRSNHPFPSLLSFWTATGLVATSQTHCKRGRFGWQPNLCAGDLSSGAGFPTDPGVFQVPLPCPNTPSCFLSPKPGDDMLSRGRELGRGRPCHLRKSPWVCSGADSASILIPLTAYKTKLHIWAEINLRENSQLASSEAACDVNAAWNHRSRSRHFPNTPVCKTPGKFF